MTGARPRGLPAVTGAGERIVAGTQPKSRVVIATDKAVLASDGQIVQDAVNRMLDRSVAKVMGKSSASDAWAKLFSPRDVVGIKVNCLFSKGAAPHPEVVSAIIGGLQRAAGA